MERTHGTLLRLESFKANAAESSDLAERLRAVIEDNAEQAMGPETHPDAQGGIVPALDAIAIELGRMVGEEERAAAALGDVADEVHRLLQGDIPHDL
jgi:hypothetical protein